MGSPSLRSAQRPDRRRATTITGTGASGPTRKALGPGLVGDLATLCGRPTIGLFAVCQDLAAIVGAVVLGQRIGHTVGPMLAVVYIGFRQRHLSNLAHECVHSKLMITRRQNRVIGCLLTGLLGEGFRPYRASHYVHHAKLGSEGDPMFESYRTGKINLAAPEPSRALFVMQVILRNAVWRLPRTAMLTLVTKGPGETHRAVIARSTIWASVAMACLSFGVLRTLLLYWIVPLVFVRPVVTWITDLGNHAGLIENDDPLLQTRGWSSHWLTRHLLGGHFDDMYHPIHHWCPHIPWRRLPEAAELAQQRLPRWSEVPWCSGYFFRRRATPDEPCVIEDIVARLATPSFQQQPHVVPEQLALVVRPTERHPPRSTLN